MHSQNLKWFRTCASLCSSRAEETPVYRFYMQQIHGINYNLISRHVSVLTTTSSPSGSARANNPIKIEKLNCDDPIRATKRAPFLIRPTTLWRYFVCMRSVCSNVRPSVNERENWLMCTAHAIRGCDSVVIITHGPSWYDVCLRVLNNEEINKKPEQRGVLLANA